MNGFINDDFLLGNNCARRLYHEFSGHLPIIDFHCHLSPAMISGDRQFEDLGQAWLEGDHYKWRAMRSNGISERFCTGDAPAREKFMKWAETVPATIGNPLFHWTHLELARYFGIFELLSPSTAGSVFDKASSLLRSKDFSTRSLIRKMNVKTICTTDDPADTLKHHIHLKESFEIPVLPGFRPDNILKTDAPSAFRAYVERIGEVSELSITGFESLVSAIDKRHSFFHEHGCRLSDHGLDRFCFIPFTPDEVDKTVKKLLREEPVSPGDNEKFRTAMLLEICRMNHKRGWVQQFHVGALRNNNARMFRKMGPDTGWDSIGTSQDAYKMSGFLSLLDESEELAKTLLYNLNPADNAMMITMASNFNDGSVAAKVQYGPAWWFLDQKDGMENHLRQLSSFSLLRRFVGMVTDSRSFMSYPRHEYFRRIACNFIGEQVEAGLIPDDDDLLKPLIEGISYRNAKEYFGF